MKRLSALMLAVLIFLSGCAADKAPSSGAQSSAADPAPQEENVDLTLWTYPVGGLGGGSSLSAMVSDFHREHPNIRISISPLTYETGDSEIEDAIERGEAPDLVLEGPERLSANWGARGLMADLKDLWDSDVSAFIYDSVESACRSENGAYYIYPLCMTTHCMAINRDVFEQTGAWKYIDEENHTWSTEDFIAAVQALRDGGVENICTIYCGGTGGDQGTRALVTNLYSGTFTNADHTAYTFNSPENVRALELLAGMDGMIFDSEKVGGEVVDDFANGQTAMSVCWNVANEVSQTISNPNLDFDIFPMTFPTDDGEYNLQGGIWGLGVFDNGDPARIEAAKEFIRFMTEDENQYTQVVLSSTFWPVRDVPNIYENDELMTEYFIFKQYMGDYYQVTPGWVGARTAWSSLLQDVGRGEDVAQTAEKYEQMANGYLEEASSGLRSAGE